MCGFTGFVDLNNKNYLNYNSILTECSNDISFRGPDESKNLLIYEKGIYLSFQRLSFQDLTKNGSQPMLSESNKYLLLFNGEIYNFRNLQRKLKNQNYNSDSRILLEYIELYGISNFIENVDGMFSIVLIDLNSRKIFFISDLFGQKPLYYSINDKLLYFSSDLRTSKNHPNLVRDIDKKSIGLYFKKNFIPAPFTIYKNFNKIMSNELIEISFDKKIELTKKYNYSYFSEDKNNNNFNKKNFQNILNNSIEEHLNSDVEIGTFLSSGIDSSLITSIASKKNSKIKSFTMGFKENKFDESSAALDIANHLKIKNVKIIFDDNNLDEMIFNTSHTFSEPFSDSSQLPYKALCKESSNHVKGVLSGDGGDELFGGYNRHIWAPWFFKYSKFNFLFKSLKIFKDLNFFNLIDKFGYIYAAEKINRLIEALMKREKYEDFYDDLTSHHEFKYILDNIENHKTDLSKYQNVKDLRSRTMLLDLFYYLPNDLMVKSDRSSMIHGLEVRSPLLSKNIYNYVDNINPKFHFNSGNKKLILKNLLSDFLPQNLINNSKRGFVAPVNIWLKNNLKNILNKYLTKEKLSHGLFNEKLIIKNYNDFLNGKNNYYAIWDLLIFQIWFDKYHN